MALSEDDLIRLPPSIQKMLRAQQQQGIASQIAAPQYQASGTQLVSDLSGAAGRRFGGQYGSEFDPTYDADVRGLLGSVPQMQAGFDLQRQRLGEDFGQSMRDLDTQNTRASKQHLVNMADRGIGRSGANLIGQERIGEQFQRGIESAVRGRESGLESLEQGAASAFQGIRSKLSQAEAAGTERARVREETRRFQEQQQLMETERARREEEAARAAEQRAQQQQDQFAQILADSQPVPTATGALVAGGGGSRGGGTASSTPVINTDSNVSVNFQEYNLRDPREVKELQSYLGLQPDGVIGPQTIQALQDLNAVYFNDRPIDPESRIRANRGSLYQGWNQ
ncbi:MAG: peptidoglycan-binding domain-containing protein [Nitrososphaeraceae archaeon]